MSLVHRAAAVIILTGAGDATRGRLESGAMARQWRCANGHAWTGEIGALTLCPECNSRDVFEVRVPGASDPPPPEAIDADTTYSQSRRHRRKKRVSPSPRAASNDSGTTLIQPLSANAPAQEHNPTPARKDLSTQEFVVPPPPGSSSPEMSTQEYPVLHPADQSTVVIAALPTTPNPTGDTLICDERCFPPPAQGSHPAFVPSSTSDSTLDMVEKRRVDSGPAMPASNVTPPEQSTMFELTAPGAASPVESNAGTESGQRNTVLAPSSSALGSGKPAVDSTGFSSKSKAPAGHAGPMPEFPGYEILGILGRGGMGVVYKARQRGLNRLVALKMILGGQHAGKGERGRFQTEAMAVAKLQHPNIVQVYEVGEHNGMPFFSLEYLDGGSLGQRTEKSPLAPDVAAAVVELLARAMQFAHSNGIVHRDLKPANILLNDNGESDPSSDVGTKQTPASRPRHVQLPFTPKITDFGLAKDLQSGSDLTGTGAILGTPCFMSPEQASGKTREIGPATDIHALGAILYDALTGHPPFLGADPMATIVQVRSMEPTPPSRWQPGVPPDLETICLKCLEKSQARRYASAGALADDLRRFLDGEPIHARPASALEKVWKWSRRRPTSAALIGLSVVGLLGTALAGGTIAKLKSQQADAELVRAENEKELRDQAIAERDRAQRESARAQANFEAARDAMDEFLTRIGDQRLRAEPRMERLQSQLLDSALGFYDRFQRSSDSADTGVRREAAWAYQRAGRIREAQGRRKEAIEAYQEADRLFAALNQQEPNEPLNRKGHADALRQLASAYEADNQPGQADAAYAQALALLERLVAEAPNLPAHRVDLATLRNSRASHLAGRGQIAESIAVFDAALADLSAKEAVALREIQLAAAKTEINRAQVLLDARRQDEGRAALESGISKLRQLAADSKDPMYWRELGHGLELLGNANRLGGQTEQAVAAFREAGTIFTKLAADHPRVPDYAFLTAKAYDDVAETLEAGRNLRAGAADREKARAIYRRLITNYPLDDEFRRRFALSLDIQGAYYEEFGQLNDAITALSEAATLFERLAAENLNNSVMLKQYGQRLVNLGVLQARAGDVEKAEASFARAAVVLESALQRAPKLDDARNSLIKAYRNQAGVMGRAGRPADEDAAWSRALTLQVKRAADFPDQPDLSAEVAASLGALADLRREKPDQRLKALRSAYDRQKTAVKLAPQRGDLMDSLGKYGLTIVESLTQSNDFAGACAAANRLVIDLPAEWPGLVKVAQSLSQCAAAARDDRKLSDADRSRAIRHCGEEAMTILRRAIAGGFRDAALLQTAPEFKELRESAEFKAEFAQLIAQIKSP